MFRIFDQAAFLRKQLCSGIDIHPIPHIVASCGKMRIADHQVSITHQVNSRISAKTHLGGVYGH